MAQGLFNLKQQLQGLIQKAWTSAQVPTTTYAGSFNGSNQDLTVANNSAFLFGTGDFTVECFFNPASITSAASNQGLVGMWGTGGQTSWLLYYSSGTFIWYTSSNGSAQTATLTVTKAITVGTWYHVALVRYSGTTTIYINGTSAGSTSTVVSLFAASCPLSIAITPAGGTPDYVNGSLSNLRIVKGVAVYTSNFAVPTSPLTNLTNTSLLTLQNATIVDNSSNAFTITNVGSVTTSANTTIFVNPSIATPAVEYLVVAGGGGGGATIAGAGGGGGLLQGLVPITSGTSLTVTVGGGGTGSSSSATPGGNGQNSVFSSVTALGGGGGGADSSSSSTNNGQSGGSGGGAGYNTSSSVSPTGGQGTFGQGNAGGTSVTVSAHESTGGGGGAGTVGGSASYNPDFGGIGGAGIASAISGTITAYAGGGGGGGSNTSSPAPGGVGGGGAGSVSGHTPSTSGTANTGGGGGGGRDYSGGNGGSGIVIISYPDIYSAPSAFGGANSPTASTSGSGSFYNAGAGALGYSGTTPFNFTGNFTVEGWYNLANFSNASAGGNPGLIGYGTANWVLVIPGGAYNFYVGGSMIASSSAVASANVWNHFAIVRNGTAVTIYHNGVSVATATNSSTISIGSNGITIGANGNGGIGSITGYMSNVRIVNGTAVYTSSFTPPTAPLTAITNTSLLVNTVSGAYTADGSSYGSAANANTTSISWNQSSPFATGLGYKNRVYTWTGSGTVTF